MAINIKEYTRAELNALAFEAGIDEETIDLAKTKQDVVNLIMCGTWPVSNGRRASTSEQGKADTAVNTAEVVNTKQMAQDACHVGKQVDQYNAQHDGHLKILVKGVHAGLKNGTLKLADADDKGRQEIIGDCALRDLFADVRETCRLESNPNGNTYDKQSAHMKATREACYKQQIKDAVKYVIGSLEEHETTDLVNEADYPRYISFSLGSPKKAVIKLFLGAGSDGWSLDATFKALTATLEENHEEYTQAQLQAKVNELVAKFKLS